MTPDLAALVAHYQDKLRLRDWRISVAYAPDLTNGEGRAVWGLCYPTADAKVAKILIRDPGTPPDGVTAEEAAAQVVETVVHELVHLHFAAFCTDSPEAIVAEEQAVWALAEALVKARGTPAETTIARAMLVNVNARRRAEQPKQANEPPQIAAPTEEDGETNIMDPSKKIEEALAAVLEGDADRAAELLHAILAASKPDAEAEPEPEPVAAPAPSKKPAKKPTQTSGAEAAPLARLINITGAPNEGAAMAEVQRWRESHVQLEEVTQRMAKERATIESAKRRRLCIDLIKGGGGTPAQVWGNDECTEPKPYFAAMPLADFEAYVADAIKANGGKARSMVIRPPGSNHTADPGLDHNGMSARERAMCEELNLDPKKYAAEKAHARAVR
jgi:hypothetical protein